MEPIKTIGKLLTEDEQRDAIHFAIAPVIAAERLSPGQHVAVVAGEAVSNGDHLGIVDPFLSGPVFKGDRFWLLLYPNTITSLRHEWVHPAFELARISKDDHKAKSEAWIAAHANLLGLSADALMGDARSILSDCGDDYIIQHGSERWRDNFNPTEFWHHYEVVTGTIVPEDKKRSFYCCTC